MFEDCVSLLSLNPKNLFVISVSAFMGCSKLSTIKAESFSTTKIFNFDKNLNEVDKNLDEVDKLLVKECSLPVSLDNMMCEEITEDSDT